MPHYEYACTCGRRFETMQRVTDPPQATCPACGSRSAVRVPSAPAIQFKGSGWYVTDYARKEGTPS